MPGEILALMGPSGAGKSTLLDILSMRKNTGAVTGTVLFNGVQQGKHHLRLLSYVPQDDQFMPCLTCLETIQFYAGLLLRKASYAEREDRIHDVFERLDLNDHRQTLVFFTAYVIFCLKEYLRRLNIAIGLISSPSVVFMDEPTSGLDSFAAVNVMHFVRDLALTRSHTIIATIHQPRLDIWKMLSKVVLLSKGKLIYEGTTTGIHPWLSGYLGYPYDPEVDGTIPDWCLDLISIDFPKPQGKRRTMRYEEDIFEASRAFLSASSGEATEDNAESPPSLSNTGQTCSPNAELAALPETNACKKEMAFQTSGSSNGSSNKTRAESDDFMFIASELDKMPHLLRCRQRILLFCWQFLLLGWRSNTFIIRNPTAVGGRLFTISWVAASVGVVFYNIPDSPQSIPTRFNVLFMSTLVLVLFPYLSVSHATADKVYYLGDMSSRLYRPFVYYISKAAVQLPFQLMNVTVFVLIVYYMTGLRSDAGSFVRHLIILMFAFLIFSQILNFAAVLAPSEDLTFVIGVCFVAFNLMFSDFFIRKDQMRFSWLGQLSTASPMKYIFEALTEIEFRNKHFYAPCVQDFDEMYKTLSAEQRAAMPYPKEIISYVLRSMSDEDGVCLVSGNGLLHFLGHQRSMVETVSILCVFLMCMHLATFFVLCCVSMYPSKK